MPEERTELTETEDKDSNRAENDASALRLLEQGRIYSHKGDKQSALLDYDRIISASEVGSFIRARASYYAAQVCYEIDRLDAAKKYIGRIPSLLNDHIEEHQEKEEAELKQTIKKYDQWEKGGTALPAKELRSIAENLSSCRLEDDYRRALDLFYSAGRILNNIENRLKAIEEQRRLEEKAKELIERGDLGTLYMQPKNEKPTKGKTNKASQKGKRKK